MRRHNLQSSRQSSVTLHADDGSSCVCRIVAVFELETWKYALLARDTHDSSQFFIAMRVLVAGGQATFDTIADDNEFAFVVDEFQSLTGAPSDTIHRHAF